MENKNIDDLVVEAKAKELKREYMRSWNEKNKNKNAEYQRKYWERKALEELKENRGVK